MVVSPTTFSSFRQNNLLHLRPGFPSTLPPNLHPSNDCPQRNVDVNIITVRSVLMLPATCITVASNNVPSVFEVKQGPMLGVAANDDVTSTTSVTSIGPAFGRHSVTHEMR
jgi:hypothetical protein